MKYTECEIGGILNMHNKYLPKTLDQKLAWLTEECGEVLSAIGKSQRFGLDSWNPEVHPSKREINADWVLRELQDLKIAIEEVEPELLKWKEDWSHG